MTKHLAIAAALLALVAGTACEGDDGDGGSAGAGGTGGLGGSGGFTGGPFSSCEDATCGAGLSCRDNACFQAECGACECGQPGCVCGGFCECENFEMGGTCVPDDFADTCSVLADEAACATDERCRWAVSGCGNTQGVAGCHPVQDCAQGWCGAEKTCTYVALEGCVGAFLCL